MSERSRLTDRSTVDLTIRFILVSLEIVKQRHSPWLFRFMSKWKSRRQKQEARELLDEIILRYSCILAEFIRRSGWQDTDWDELGAEVWGETAAGVVTATSRYNFARILWTAAASVIGKDVPAVKPKFMLRQFMEEVIPSEESEFWLWCAYGEIDLPSVLSDSEFLQWLTSACASLHQALLFRLDKLEQLTDGVIKQEVIFTLTNDWQVYEDWLLEPLADTM